MHIYDSILDTIGNTPLIKFKHRIETLEAEILLKLEFFNPLSSIKDRIAKALIENAEKLGTLKPNMHIVEPTSGNTGIGLAFVAAVKGYKVTLIMPDNMSIERQLMLKSLGANLILTPASKGIAEAVNQALKMANDDKNIFLPQQFENPINPLCHSQTTAEEIWRDTDGKIDIFIAGVGTGGTISGVGQTLKNKNPNIKIIAVEPKESALLSGETANPHKIQGIGANFIPANVNKSIIDKIIKISSEEAINTSRLLSRSYGIPAGISSGATVLASINEAKLKENKNKIIVTILASSTERYLSTALTEDIR